MKRFNLFLVSTLLVGFAICGCNPLQKMKNGQANVTHKGEPPVLELVGNQVNVSITGKYPPKYFNQNVIITMMPTLQAGSNEKDLEVFNVQGEAIKENAKYVIKFDAGGSFSKPTSFPYQPEYQQSKLVLKQTATFKKKTLDFEPIDLADGIITTCLLVEKKWKSAYAKDDYKPLTAKNFAAPVIPFQIQQSEVKATTSKELQPFMDQLKNAAGNNKVQIKNVELSAYASPDGAARDYPNDKLAENRGKNAKEFYTKMFKATKADEKIKSELLQVLTTPEDWEGFKKELEASNIRDKELVLRVLSMYSNPKDRDREIHNISKVFEDIKSQILPNLRRAQLKINYDEQSLTESEINAQFDKDPKELSLEALLYAGARATDPNRKLAIYKAAAESNEDGKKDWRAKNNLGAAYLDLNRNDEAKAALAEAKDLKDNETVKNNLAVVALRAGNTEEAEALLNSAGASDEVKYNLGTIKIIKGAYADAITNFGNQVEVNAALAKLLAKQNDEALSTLNSVKGDEALVAYLKAIVGARKGDNDLLMSNLRNACSKSADLKKRAKTDLEFIKYFQDSTFKSIVN